MAGFLYYIAGVTDGGRPDDILAVLRRRGLGYAFPGRCSLERVGCKKGPDGGQGLIVGDTRRLVGVDVGYYPDKQSWRRIPEALLSHEATEPRSHEEKPDVAVWVGHAKDVPPGPVDLLRADAIGGTPVELGDGNEWIVPVVRAWISVEGAAGWAQRLPTSSELGEDGTWRPGAVLPAYTRVSEAAQAWWDALVAGSDEATEPRSHEGEGKQRVTLTFDGIHEAAVCVLAANYAIGATEAAMLGLIQSAAVSDVMMAAVDWATFRAWVEKKTAGESTAAGSPS